MKKVCRILGITTRQSASWLLGGASTYLVIRVAFMALRSKVDQEPLGLSVLDVLITTVVVVLISISGWAVYSKSGKAIIEELEQNAEFRRKPLRVCKVLFASWAASIATMMIIVTVIVVVSKKEWIDFMFSGWFWIVLLVGLCGWYPFMNRHLK